MTSQSDFQWKEEWNLARDFHVQTCGSAHWIMLLDDMDTPIRS